MNTIRQTIVALVRSLLLVALLLTGLIVSTPARAFAAPGVQGALDNAQLYSYTTDWDILYVGGWAYNPHTNPTQSVRFVAYYVGGGDDRSMGDGDKALYADQNRGDLVASGRTSTPDVGFSGYVSWPRDNSKHAEWVCAWAHDTGEDGGWYQIGCATVA